MSVLSGGPWPGAASEKGFKTDEVAQVDEEQGQHPDDQPHHHLDGQHRSGLRLAETTWAKLFSHFNVELEQGDHHMFTVTVCRLDTGVDVNLSLFPGAINVEPGRLRALASAPKTQQSFSVLVLSHQPAVHMVSTR